MNQIQGETQNQGQTQAQAHSQAQDQSHNPNLMQSQGQHQNQNQEPSLSQSQNPQLQGNKQDVKFGQLKAIVHAWTTGFVYSISYSSAIKFFAQAPRLQKLTWENTKPNFMLAISALIYECYLNPFFKNMEKNIEGSQISTIASYVYLFAWGVPVYGYCFYMNMKWLGELSKISYEASDSEHFKSNKDQVTSNQAGNVQQNKQIPNQEKQQPQVVLAFKYNDKIQVTEDIIKYVILGLFFLQIKLVQLYTPIPGLGFVLAFIMYTWFNAVFVFECKWGLEKKHLDYRISLVEKCWPFFSGFGMLMTCAQLLPPFLIGASLQLILYPFYVLQAMDINQHQIITNSAKYVDEKGHHLSTPQLPLFYFSTAPAVFIVKRYFKNINTKVEKKTQ